MRYFVIFASLVLVCVLIFAALPINGETEIYDSFARLHILANSDSEADQALKLKVRDAVLSVMYEKLNSCASVEQAKSIMTENTGLIQSAAEAVIAEYGYDYAVSVELGDEYYPTRIYDGISLPAGTYWSVRIKIGSAEGHNWWCILFPPLCTDTAKPKEKLKETGFSQSQIRILTDSDKVRYVMKFKILELLGRMFSDRV